MDIPKRYTVEDVQREYALIIDTFVNIENLSGSRWSATYETICDEFDVWLAKEKGEEVSEDVYLDIHNRFLSIGADLDREKIAKMIVGQFEDPDFLRCEFHDNGGGIAKLLIRSDDTSFCRNKYESEIWTSQ